MQAFKGLLFKKHLRLKTPMFLRDGSIFQKGPVCQRFGGLLAMLS
jgi:hypothetical protein